MEKEQRKQLRASLKWALTPDGWRRWTDSGRLREWFAQKLEGCMAYGIVDKSKLPSRALKMTHLHYVEKVSVKQLAIEFRIPERVVAHDLTGVLDYIIAHAPDEILESLCPRAFKEIVAT